MHLRQTALLAVITLLVQSQDEGLANTEDCLSHCSNLSCGELDLLPLSTGNYPDVCGYTVNVDGCFPAVSHVHAALICDTLYMRLCTVEELQANETAGTGCDLDTELIWSSSNCTRDGHETEPHYYWAALGQNGGEDVQPVQRECVQESENERIYQRCCADVDLSICCPESPLGTELSDPCNETNSRWQEEGTVDEARQEFNDLNKDCTDAMTANFQDEPLSTYHADCSEGEDAFRNSCFALDGAFCEIKLHITSSLVQLEKIFSFYECFPDICDTENDLLYLDRTAEETCRSEVRDAIGDDWMPYITCEAIPSCSMPPIIQEQDEDEDDEEEVNLHELDGCGNFSIDAGHCEIYPDLVDQEELLVCFCASHLDLQLGDSMRDCRDMEWRGVPIVCIPSTWPGVPVPQNCISDLTNGSLSSSMNISSPEDCQHQCTLEGYGGCCGYNYAQVEGGENICRLCENCHTWVEDDTIASYIAPMYGTAIHAECSGGMEYSKRHGMTDLQTCMYLCDYTLNCSGVAYEDTGKDCLICASQGYSIVEGDLGFKFYLKLQIESDCTLPLIAFGECNAVEDGFGKSLQCSCPEIYDPIGDDERLCVDGQWDGVPLVCVGKLWGVSFHPHHVCTHSEVEIADSHQECQDHCNPVPGDSVCCGYSYAEASPNDGPSCEICGFCEYTRYDESLFAYVAPQFGSSEIGLCPTGSIYSQSEGITSLERCMSLCDASFNCVGIVYQADEMNCWICGFEDMPITQDVDDSYMFYLASVLEVPPTFITPPPPRPPPTASPTPRETKSPTQPPTTIETKLPTQRPSFTMTIPPEHESEENEGAQEVDAEAEVEEEEEEEEGEEVWCKGGAQCMDPEACHGDCLHVSAIMKDWAKNDARLQYPDCTPDALGPHGFKPSNTLFRNCWNAVVGPTSNNDPLYQEFLREAACYYCCGDCPDVEEEEPFIRCRNPNKYCDDELTNCILDDKCRSADLYGQITETSMRNPDECIFRNVQTDELLWVCFEAVGGDRNNLAGFEIFQNLIQCALNKKCDDCPKDCSGSQCCEAERCDPCPITHECLDDYSCVERDAYSCAIKIDYNYNSIFFKDQFAHEFADAICAGILRDLDFDCERLRPSGVYRGSTIVYFTLYGTLDENQMSLNDVVDTLTDSIDKGKQLFPDDGQFSDTDVLDFDYADYGEPLAIVPVEEEEEQAEHALDEEELSGTSEKPLSKQDKLITIATIVAVGGFVLIFCIIYCYCKRKRRIKRGTIAGTGSIAIRPEPIPSQELEITSGGEYYSDERL